MGDGSAALWGWGGWSIPPSFCYTSQTYERMALAPAFSLLMGVELALWAG